MGQESFTVTLGGRERTFKWTRAVRNFLEERHNKGLLELIREDVLPCYDNGMPTGGGRWNAQVDFVWQGLRHAGPAITQSRVSEWMEALCDGGGSILEVLAPANASCLASGVLGFKYEIPSEEEPEDAEGKGDAEPTTGSEKSDTAPTSSA